MVTCLPGLPGLNQRGLLPALRRAVGYGWAVLSFVGLTATPVLAGPQEELDRVITQAGTDRPVRSLNDFLNRPDVIEAYFSALQSYYGAEHFPRAQFDRILHQLRESVSRVPELGVRLWETTHLGESFSVTTRVESYGRDLDAEGLDAQLREWRERLAAVRSRANLAQSETVAVRLEAVRERINQRLEETAGLPRVARDTAREAFFGELRAQPEFRALCAELVRTYLDSESFAERVRTREADVILNTLREIHANSREAIQRALGLRLPAGATEVIQELAPDVSQWLERRSAFPVRWRYQGAGANPEGGTATARYDFIPLARRIHGIWNGIAYGECVAGSAAPNHQDWLTPERWAVIALRESQQHHVFRQGRGALLGVVQSVPMTPVNPTHRREITASVDFNGGIFNHPVTVGDGSPGNPHRRTSFYELWLSEADRHRPERWSGGFVMSHATGFNNSGVQDTVHRSASYILGSGAGLSTEYVLLDPLARRIVGLGNEFVPNLRELRQRQSSFLYTVPYRYMGRMVVDGLYASAGYLTRLTPNQDLSVLENEENWLRIWRGSIGRNGRRSILYRFADRQDGGVWSSAFEAVIFEALHHPDPLVREAAALQCEKISDPSLAARNFTPRIRRRLALLLRDSNPMTRVLAFNALGSVPPTAANDAAARVEVFLDRGHLGTYSNDIGTVHAELAHLRTHWAEIRRVLPHLDAQLLPALRSSDADHQLNALRILNEIHRSRDPSLVQSVVLLLGEGRQTDLAALTFLTHVRPDLPEVRSAFVRRANDGVRRISEGNEDFDFIRMLEAIHPSFLDNLSFIRALRMLSTHPSVRETMRARIRERLTAMMTPQCGPGALPRAAGEVLTRLRNL